MVEGEPVRLHGGEESAAYRVGGYVVRVGVTWQSTARLEWSYRVAQAAAAAVPEAVAPLLTPSGASVVRLEGRPVTLWPFVDGTWAAKDEHFEAAADLLARLHRALAEVALPACPPDVTPLAAAPDLDDAVLDDWLIRFGASHSRVQAQHGDYYHGNLLAADGRLVGLLDWDEAFVGPAEIGLVNGAWEWGNGLWAEDLDNVFEFVDRYLAAGGTAHPLSELDLRQLVRSRLRREIRYSRLHNPDPDYEARQILVYERLEPGAA